MTTKEIKAKIEELEAQQEAIYNQEDELDYIDEENLYWIGEELSQLRARLRNKKIKSAWGFKFED